jgi:hypothetical protein
MSSIDVDIKQIVKDSMGRQPLRLSPAHVAAGPSNCCSSTEPITKDLYSLDQMAELPEKAVLASLGCGNPTALAELSPGETVPI